MVANRRVQTSLQERNQRYENQGKLNTGEEIRTLILKELKPVIETKSVKRGGTSHQVPTLISEQRGRYRACKWIREATLKRAKKRGVPLGKARRLELIAVYDELNRRQSGRSTNTSVKRQSEPRQMRDRRHRAAKANRVYSK